MWITVATIVIVTTVTNAVPCSVRNPADLTLCQGQIGAVRLPDAIQNVGRTTDVTLSLSLPVTQSMDSITLRLQPSTKGSLEVEADELGVSRSEYIRNILRSRTSSSGYVMDTSGYRPNMRRR